MPSILGLMMWIEEICDVLRPITDVWANFFHGAQYKVTGPCFVPLRDQPGHVINDVTDAGLWRNLCVVSCPCLSILRESVKGSQ